MTLTKIGKYYHARVKTTDGKHKTISTHTTSKKEAEQVVSESGIEHLETAAKAGRLTREAIGLITTGKKLTVAKAIEKFIESLSRRQSPGHVYNTRQALNQWLAATPIGSLPPSAITDSHVDGWVNEDNPGVKAGRRRMRLSLIRSFCDYCSDMGWMIGNPAGRRRVTVDLGKLSHEQKETKAIEPFTAAELRKFTDYCKSEGHVFWQFAALVSWEIGLRLGDIASLEWDSFNTPGRAIVWTMKRDRRVSVPISDALSDVLAQIPVASEKYLFPNERALYSDLSRRANLSTYFKRYCSYAKIESGKTFHSIRHACVTRWSREGKSLEDIATDVGHASTKTTQGYIH